MRIETTSSFALPRRSAALRPALLSSRLLGLWGLSGLSGLLLLAASAFLSPAASAQPLAPAPDEPTAAQDAAAEEPPPIELEPPADPDLEGMEPSVAERLREERQALMALIERPDIDLKLLAEAMGEMGFVYQAHGLEDAAALSYRNAIRLAPEDFRWSHALAVLSFEANDLELAQTLFERTLSLERQNLGAWLYLTEIFLTRGELDLAAKTVANAAAISSSSPAVLDLQGRVAMALDKPEEAVEAFEFALAQVPDANRLHYELGMAYRALENMDKAREHLAQSGKVGVQIPDPLRREVERRKSGERLLLLEGRRAFNAGAYAAAAEAFRRALEAQPESLTARVNLASALALSGESQKAIAELEAVLAEDPDRQEARFNLGSLLRRTGRLADAATLLEDVVEEDPDDLEALRELGITYRDLNRMDESETILRKVTERSNDPIAIVALAELMARQGRYADAKDFLMERHLMNPQPGQVATGLARLLAAAPLPELRDGRKAVVLAQKAMEASSTVRSAETLALALAEAGRCDEAAQIQRQLLAADGVAPESLAQMAETLSRYAQGPPCRPPFPTDPSTPPETHSQ